MCSLACASASANTPTRTHRNRKMGHFRRRMQASELASERAAALVWCARQAISSPLVGWCGERGERRAHNNYDATERVAERSNDFASSRKIEDSIAGQLEPQSSCRAKNHRARNGGVGWIMIKTMILLFVHSQKLDNNSSSSSSRCNRRRRRSPVLESFVICRRRWKIIAAAGGSSGEDNSDRANCHRSLFFCCQNHDCGHRVVARDWRRFMAMKTNESMENDQSRRFWLMQQQTDQAATEKVST